jgi:hypothetical protein
MFGGAKDRLIVMLKVSDKILLYPVSHLDIADAFAGLFTLNFAGNLFYCILSRYL